LKADLTIGTAEVNKVRTRAWTPNSSADAEGQQQEADFFQAKLTNIKQTMVQRKIMKPG